MNIYQKTRKRDGLPSFYIDFCDQRGRRVQEVAGTNYRKLKRRDRP